MNVDRIEFVKSVIEIESGSSDENKSRGHDVEVMFARERKPKRRSQREEARIREVKSRCKTRGCRMDT